MFQAEWNYGHFRDCNGISNGTPLSEETLAAEAAAGHYKGTPAGAIGPPPKTAKKILTVRPPHSDTRIPKVYPQPLKSHFKKPLQHKTNSPSLSTLVTKKIHMYVY